MAATPVRTRAGTVPIVLRSANKVCFFSLFDKAEVTKNPRSNTMGRCDRVLVPRPEQLVL